MDLGREVRALSILAQKLSRPPSKPKRTRKSMCRGALPCGRNNDEEEEEGRSRRMIRRLVETYAELAALRTQLAEATALLERSRAHLEELSRRLVEERTAKRDARQAN